MYYCTCSVKLSVLLHVLSVLLHVLSVLLHMLSVLLHMLSKAQCTIACAQVLCLNHNRVESLLPGRDALPPKTQVLHSLQVLHLA